MNKEFAYLLGMINIGDGWICYNDQQRRYNIGMVSIDKELTEYFSFCCQIVFGKSAHIYLRKSNNPKWNDRYFAYLCKKEAVLYFLNFAPLDFYRDQTCKIVPIVFDFPPELKASYLQAFFDSQGSVYITNHIITGVKKQQEPLIGIQKLLKSLGINSTVKKNTVVIYNKNIPRFKQLIGFKCHRKQNKLNAIPEPHYQRAFTEQEVNYIIDGYYNGISWRKMAQALNCSKGAIQYRINKHCNNPIAVHVPIAITPPLGTASPRL